MGHDASPRPDARETAQPGTLLAEIITELTVTGWETRVLLAHEQSLDPDSLLAQDLVVHRGLHTSQTPLLGAIDDRDIPLCTPFAADQLLRDLRAWHARLAEAGLPVPPAVDRASWASVLGAGKGGEIVVKAMSGPGRGCQVLAGTASTLPPDAPFPGPYLIEPRLPAGDTDRKLFVAGSVVRGQLKPSTLNHAHVTSGAPFTPETKMVELALEVGRALGTHLFGVDVLRTPDGPVVVDVNAFPGFRGIDDAPTLVTAHLREHARAG